MSHVCVCWQRNPNGVVKRVVISFLSRQYRFKWITFGVKFYGDRDVIYISYCRVWNRLGNPKYLTLEPNNSFEYSGSFFASLVVFAFFAPAAWFGFCINIFRVSIFFFILRHYFQLIGIMSLLKKERRFYRRIEKIVFSTCCFVAKFEIAWFNHLFLPNILPAAVLSWRI